MLTDPVALRALYGPPHPKAVAKMLAHIDANAHAFIAASPFILIATSDGERLDVSPKGDAPGFVQTDGDRAILIPDWPGNSRIDGLLNICRLPRAGVIFMVPTVKETMRINGPATIHEEEEVRARFARGGKLPITVLRVEAEEVFVHCAKAFMRSRLWEPASWPETRPVPTMPEMLRPKAEPAAPVESDAEMLERYAKTLY
jgi:uncharacterized protein